MKKIILFVLLCAIGIISTAQNCSRFYNLNEGASGEITSYEANDKVSVIMNYEIKNVTSSGGITTATMSSQIKDGKGKYSMDSDYDFTCDGDKVTMDFSSMMNQRMLQRFEGMESEVTGTNLIFPNSLDVGQTLPDASVVIKISMSGINMEMITSISDRKVIDQESVTTKAGTFNCYVITYTTEFDMMGTNQTSNSKQWISEGVGMVKQEDYNDKGKMTNKSELTAFSN